jgi:5-methylcytosine-specific restriction endonuclease McrA
LPALSRWVLNDYFRRKNKTFMLVNMEIHHIKKYSEGGTKKNENLELLCKECHKGEHSKCNAGI